MKSNALSLPFAGNGLGVCCWSCVTGSQWRLSKTSPSWMIWNEELFISNSTQPFARYCCDICDVLWGVWEEKLLGSNVISSSAMGWVCHRLLVIWPCRKGTYRIFLDNGGDSTGLTQTSEFLAASVLLLSRQRIQFLFSAVWAAQEADLQFWTLQTTEESGQVIEEVLLHLVR